VYSVIQK